MREVQNYSVPQLMKMLRDGNLPASILDSPQAMALLLSRVQEFNRLMEMQTNILKNLHETQMAIIRNLKP